jgi:hypothetical protein
VENNRQKCAGEGATFTLAACPRTDALGGCRVQQGGVAITTWYYADKSTTVDDIRHLCEGLAGNAPGGLTVEFVSP